MTTEATHATETTAPAAPAAPAAGTDVAKTVARLRRTFATGRTRNVEWRKEQLRALKQLMVENETKVADALEKDLGRSPFEAWLADVASTALRPPTRRRTWASGPSAATVCWKCRSCPAAAAWSTSHTARC